MYSFTGLQCLHFMMTVKDTDLAETHNSSRILMPIQDKAVYSTMFFFWLTYFCEGKKKKPTVKATLVDIPCCLLLFLKNYV